MYDIKVKVNGEEVKLTEFPAKIITDVIIAMLGTLKGVEDVENAVLQIEKSK